jgi:hypothetical protein
MCSSEQHAYLAAATPAALLWQQVLLVAVLISAHIRQPGCMQCWVSVHVKGVLAPPGLCCCSSVKRCIAYAIGLLVRMVAPAATISAGTAPRQAQLTWNRRTGLCFSRIAAHQCYRVKPL